MSSPENEKRKKKKEPMLTLTSLPEDLLVNCLARVSRLYHPLSLSLVSKRFQSLLATPELYKVRSRLGCTESCLYVCIYSAPTRSPSWFTLCRKPDQPLTNDTGKSMMTKKSSGYVLAKVSIPHSPPAYASGLVSVGSSIYNIRSSVSILDCTSHTWRNSTSFPRELRSYSASVLNEKIYVAGAYVDDDNGSLKNSFKVLDTKSQIWDILPSYRSDTDNYFLHKGACFDGKFFVKTKGNDIAYNSAEGRWDLVGGRMGECMYSEDSYCVIENVLYAASRGWVKWYDTTLSKWSILKGSLPYPNPPKNSHIHVKLADYGGKMVILWDETSSCFTKTMIWCAEVVLEKKRENHEIWGKVGWVDQVLTVPSSCYLVKALAVTV